MKKPLTLLLTIMSLTAFTNAQTTGIHLDNLDTSVEPQKDFY